MSFFAELKRRNVFRVGAAYLVGAVQMCFCGAPFDLEATPNFKSRLEEAGFDWPPPTILDFPLKDW